MFHVLFREKLINFSNHKTRSDSTHPKGDGFVRFFSFRSFSKCLCFVCGDTALHLLCAMLQRNSKPSLLNWIRKGAAILFVVEAASFGVSYLLWQRLNTDRGMYKSSYGQQLTLHTQKQKKTPCNFIPADFRQYMNGNFPSILNGYYKVGEYLNPTGPNNSLRTIDAEYWRHGTTKVKQSPQ